MDDKPLYLEHRQRLRDRFKKTGGNGLEDYEALELLLTYVIPRRDVKPIAKTLLKRFGGLAGVLEAKWSDLETITGLGETSSTLLMLVKELFIRYTKAEVIRNKNSLSSPDSTMKFLKTKLAGLHHEAFLVVMLNVKNEFLAEELISEGTVNKVVVFPRRVIESALAHHAARVILVHNHPSGSVKPSDEDIKLTNTIVEAARPLDIKVLDHIVVGKEGFYSFVENGLMSPTR